MTTEELRNYIDSKGGIASLSTAELRDAIATVDEIDPYTILGLIEEIFTLIKQEGTDVFINGEPQDRIDFLTDPQTQLTNLVQLTNELGIEDTRLDALIDALNSTKADASTVTSISNQVDKNTSDIANIVGKSGTTINVGGVAQTLINFDSDPQSQIDILDSDIQTLDNDKATNESVALNTQAIAKLDLDKQNKLSQTDLDNIAMLNQLPDKLNAKQDKYELLWRGSSQKVEVNFNNYDSLMIVMNMDLVQEIATIYPKLKNRVSNVVMATRTDGTRYSYVILVDNNIIKLEHVGFFNKANDYTSRIGSQAYVIKEIYGSK